MISAFWWHHRGAVVTCSRTLNITNWHHFSLLSRMCSVAAVAPFLLLTASLPLLLCTCTPPAFFDLPSPPLLFCWGSLLNFNWANFAMGSWCHHEQLLRGKKKYSSDSANMCRTTCLINWPYLHACVYSFQICINTILYCVMLYCVWVCERERENVPKLGVEFKNAGGKKCFLLVLFFWFLPFLVALWSADRRPPGWS